MDWVASVRRSLLRALWSGELDSLLEQYPADAKAIAGPIRIEGICSGMFERVARKLAGRAAAAAATEVHVDGTNGLDEAFARFKSRETSAEAVERELEHRRLDWIRIRGTGLTVADEQVAREAALCISDGIPFEEVAAQAGVEAKAVSRYLDEAEPVLQAQLLSAEEGSVIGPVQIGEEFLLLRVEAKRLPGIEDFELRRRAEEALMSRAVDRELNQRVRWLEQL